MLVKNFDIKDPDELCKNDRSKLHQADISTNTYPKDAFHITMIRLDFINAGAGVRH